MKIASGLRVYAFPRIPFVQVGLPFVLSFVDTKPLHQLGPSHILMRTCRHGTASLEPGTLARQRFSYGFFLPARLRG